MRKTEKPDRRKNAAPVRNTNRERQSSTGRRSTGERSATTSARKTSEEKIDSFQIIDIRQKRAEEKAEEERQKALERAEAEKRAEALKKRSAEIEALKLRRKAQRAQEAAKAHAAREEAARAAARAREEAARAEAKARTEAKARALKASRAEEANRAELNARAEAASRTAREVRAAAGTAAPASTAVPGSETKSGSSIALDRTLESSRNFSSVHSAARKIRTESGIPKRTAPKAVIPGMDAFLAELEAAKRREAEEARQREIERARQQELEKARQREQEAARIREEEARKRREAEEERIRALEEQKRLEEERQRYLEQEAARKREEAEQLRAEEARRRKEAEAERIREIRIAKIREAEAARVHQEEQIQLGAEVRKLRDGEGQEVSIEAGLEAEAERFSAEAELLLEEEREMLAADLQEELSVVLPAESDLPEESEEDRSDAEPVPEEEPEYDAEAVEEELEYDAEADEADSEYDAEAADEAEETDLTAYDDDDYDDDDYDFPFGRPDSDLTERVDPQDQAGTVKKQSENSPEKKLFNRKRFDAMLGKIIAAILVFFMVFNLLMPDKEKSVIENRELKQIPKLSAGSIADGSFTGSFESWQSDQFVGRNLLRNVQIFLRWLGGDRLENGVYLGKNGQLLEEIVRPDEELLQGNIAAMNAFAEAHPDRNVRMMLVPDAGTLLGEQYPLFAEKRDQRADYEQVKGNLSERYEWIDVVAALEHHADEKLYYKTDHHWTSRAAQIAYEKYCEQAGLEPGVFTEKAVSNTFNGSLSSTSGFCMGEKETIEIYLPENGPDYLVSYVDEQVKTASLYDVEKLNTKDQYAMFLRGNHSVIDIHTTLDNGKVLLVFKDSFANSILPFLTTQYSEIVVCDPRYYYGDATELMNTYPVTDVLFLYSGNTFFADNNLQGVLGV